jgi:tRNA (guanine37-N1)-methyltransferase
MLDVRILTIFPGILDSFLTFGNPARAIQDRLLAVHSVDIRDFTRDRHRSTDDYPYGGGTGMVMKPEPVVRAVRHARETMDNPRVVLMTPQGRRFDQTIAEELALLPALVLVCGRYEGLDERIRAFVDDELSIGDYVLSGGETAAAVIIDAVCRLIPGVLGADSHVDGESFYNGMLEYPQYTRPRVFEGLEVPAVLLEGHHENIRRWRKAQALMRTRERRPDLIRTANLDQEARELLDEIGRQPRHGERT